MEEKKTLYTEEGFRKLQEELEYLKGEKMNEVKERLAEARGFGDLSENSEYDEARDEQTKVVTRIQDIEELLLHAVVVKESELETDIVHLGSTVKLYDYEFEEEIEYSIVGTNEVDAIKGFISDQSPIGAALLGSHKGDDVSVSTPVGVRKYKVVDTWRAKNN